MPEPPRRRRSTQPPPSSNVLPTIALGIGVVVAGLGIGALLSALQHRSETSTRTVSRAAPVVTPVARATRAPIAIATFFAHPTASPSPRVTATPRATPSPRASATPRPTPSASPTPAGTPTAGGTATPSATATPRATPTPHATPKPVAAASARPVETPRPTERPTPRPTERPTPHPTERPTPAPASVARAVPPAPVSAAQSTVRRYLNALIAGNDAGAYAELGRAPGEGGLSERSFIDRETRITSMRTTSTDPTGATVEVELSSSHGPYVATYHVTNGPNGPVIDQHDYIKM